jgi:hydrogenase maturation protein HypF
LPGGDAAAKDARRTALSLWWTLYGPDAVLPLALHSLLQREQIQGWRAVWKSPELSTQCSSAGRLFDGAAVLCGLGELNRYEGELPMRLEHLCRGIWELGPRLPVEEEDILRVDWSPLLSMLADETVEAQIRARRFHGALARAIVDVARLVGVQTVALSGGCFQNGVLLECAIELLRAAGMRAFWSQRVPPNDGGLSLGQVVAAVRRVRLVN